MHRSPRRRFSLRARLLLIGPLAGALVVALAAGLQSAPLGLSPDSRLWILAALTLAMLGAAIVFLQRAVASPLQRIVRAAAALEAGEPLPRIAPGSLPDTRLLAEAIESLGRQLDHRRLALRHELRHDGLTGLLSRVGLRERLQQRLDSAPLEPLATLVVDLTHFREVNDTFGREVANQVLKAVAGRLVKLLERGDLAARLEGDIFAVVRPGADAATAGRVARTIVDTLEQAIGLDQSRELYLGASIGISLAPRDGTEAERLLCRAESARQVSRHERARFAFYDQVRDRRGADRLALVNDLRQAMEQDALMLHYQPQVAIASGKVVGVEALLRWRHRAWGLLPLDEVIPVAEQTGLIRPLTRWVADTAIRQCARWRELGLDLPVAVNVSYWSLQGGGLVALIRDHLRKWGVPARSLALEITEGVMMADTARTRLLLEELRALGVRLAIDDFGTGFSSLSYLKRLPVSELKIDKSFVMDMAQDEGDAVIVRSTIELAHGLGLSVIAEGVEERAAWDMLAAQGCDLGQGYYISEPLAPEPLMAWLDSRRSALTDAG